MSDTTDTRLLGLLETLVAQHHEARAVHAEDTARQVHALEAQHAATRRVVRWFGAFILAFGAIAAFAVARPALVWLLAG
jgi:hypothetical protein